MYVAVNRQAKIVRVDGDGTYQTIASVSNGDPLFFPSANAFRPKGGDHHDGGGDHGSNGGNRHEIFITNFAAPGGTFLGREKVKTVS